MSKRENATASDPRDGEPPIELEAKIPEEASNVLLQATQALKTLARRQSGGQDSN
jgi:hypothetical protein